MTVLVTGAAGFLGRHVVAELGRGGHRVRALVRRNAQHLGGSGAEIVQADLLNGDLGPALADIDAVVHLATVMSGSDHERFAGSLIGTERLLDAMVAAGVERIVHCSSFSVYDWLSARREADESLPLDPDPHGSGPYAAAKVWQEELVHRYAKENDWQLSVLRPGFIWGPGNECPDASIGKSFGPVHLVFGPLRRPCYVHVETCAVAFRKALERGNAVGKTVNLVDTDRVSAWTFMGEYLRRSGIGGFRVPVPTLLLAPFVAAAYGVARLVFGPSLKVPNFFVPANFAEIYRPRRYDGAVQAALLAGEPIPSFEERLAETYACGRAEQKNAA